MPTGIYEHRKGYKRLPRSKEWNDKISQSRLGKKHSEETKKKMSENNAKPMLGMKFSDETRQKMRQSHLGVPKLNMRGANNHLWKGGITPINKALRMSFEYEEWRKAVFERDLYTCVHCGLIGGRLNADHIKPFSLYHELRFDLDNGQTLCVACHTTKTIKDYKIYEFHKKI